MYLEHFGLRESPFRITPQLEYFFSGAQRGAMLDALKFAISHDEGIVLVTGEVGTGKTMLSRMLIEQLDESILLIYLANPTLSPHALLATLAIELSIKDFDPLGALRQIEERLIALYGENRRVLLIIDEAHAMPRESLEQVRLLSNLESPTRKLLQIALFGQPELDVMLATRDMRSLRERVTQRFSLRPLQADEIGKYLQFRLHAAGYRGPSPFSRSALAIIGRTSLGLSRRVNILADKALLAAFADGFHVVGRKQAQIAVRDAAYPNPNGLMMDRPQRHYALGLAALGVVTAIGVAVGVYLFSFQTEPAAPVSAAPEIAASAPVAETSAPLAVVASTNNNASAPVAASAAPAMPVELSTRERIDLSLPRIAASTSDQWFVQLLTVRMTDGDAVDAFIAKAGESLDDQDVLIYESAPRQRMGVIYGQYATQAEAAQTLAKLPTWIRSGGAYVRSYKAFK